MEREYVRFNGVTQKCLPMSTQLEIIFLRRPPGSSLTVEQSERSGFKTQNGIGSLLKD